MISHPKVFHASTAEVRILFSGVLFDKISVLRNFCFHVRLEHDVDLCSTEAVIFAGLSL